MSLEFPSLSEGPVLVIGAAGVDMVGQLRGDLKPGTSNPAQIRTSFGGVARNVAENLAHLGQPVTLLTAVGQDAPGDQLLQQTALAGVDVSAVLQTTEHPTGSYLAIVNQAGELQFAMDDMRVVTALSPAYIRERAGLFEMASWLFIDANLSKETLRTVMSLARKAHLPVCADPTSTGLASRLQPYLSRLHLITPNSAEAAALCSRSFDVTQTEQAVEIARCLVGNGVDVVIITLAEFGVSYASSQTSGHIPAIRTQIVDPTGAGDALTAAVIYALINNIALDDAVRLGVSAASLTLRYRGTVAPDLSLERLYDQLVV